MTNRKLDERGEDRGRHARRRWREIFDNLLPVIVAAIVVILAALALLSVGVFSNARNARTAATKARTAVSAAAAALERQQLTSRNGCERVQLLRDDVNVTAWGVYNALDLAETGGPDPARIQALLDAVDPDTRALLTALLAGGASSRQEYVRIRDAQRYLPPTDCAIAPLDPEYRFPQPIPFGDVAGCYDPMSNPRPLTECPPR